MEDFFQSYGSWILFGAMPLVCILMHVLGIGHGGHGHGHQSRPVEGAAATRDQPDK